MKYLFACGGTGGHIFPALAVAEKIKQLHGKNAEVLFTGSDNGMEKEIVESRGFAFKGVSARPLVRRAFFKNAVHAALVAKSFFEAKKIVKEFAPDCVFGTGGFASFPAVFVSAVSGIKTVIHEPNMEPGLANKALAVFCSAVTAGFGETAKFFPAGKVTVTGNPVRESLYKVSKAQGRRNMGIKGTGPVILIMPGSRAAASINRAVVEALPLLKKRIKGASVVWMTGKEFFSKAKEAVKKAGIKAVVTEFIDDAASAYAACDAAVLRAGAGTLSETAALKVPAVLVPYPYAAANHQEINAAVFEKSGAAIVIKDRELNGRALAEAAAVAVSKRENAAMRKKLAAMKFKNGTGAIIKVMEGR